jgi:hypothetical protein
MIFPPFRHQKLFSTNSIWFMLEAFKVGGQFVLTTHPVARPAKCNEHPPQSVWSFPTSSASSLDQKFLFHAVRKDPIEGMSTTTSVALLGVFLRSTTMTIALDWRTSGAAIDPQRPSIQSRML